MQLPIELICRIKQTRVYNVNKYIVIFNINKFDMRRICEILNGEDADCSESVATIKLNKSMINIAGDGRSGFNKHPDLDTSLPAVI